VDILTRLMNLWSDQEKLDSTMVLYAIVIYPLFGVNHFLHGQEPLWGILGRFLLTFIFFLRYKFEKIAMVKLKNQLIWVFMAYLMVLVYRSEFLPDYLIGYFLALFVSTLVMDDPKSIFQFYIFVVIFSLSSFLDPHAEVKPAIIVMVNFVVGLISFVLVAGRKGLQNKIIQSELFFNQIINQQNDAVFVTELSGKVVFCNKEARRLFEIPASSEGFYFHNFISKTLNDREKRLFEKELERKGEASYETEMITIGESKFYGFLKFKEINNKSDKQHLISVTDLTTIKASQERVKALLVESEKNNKELISREEKMKILLSEMRAAEQKFRSLNEALPVGVFMTDRLGNCVYANPKLLEILNIDYVGIIGASLTIFLDEFNQIIFKTYWENIDKFSSIEEVQIMFNPKDKLNGIHTKLKIKPNIIEGKLQGYVVTIEDISNLVEKEVALMSSNKEAIKAKISAENALKVRSEFLSNMSHEIRTPINAIIGLTDILVNEVEGEVLENLKVVKYSADSLLSLVNDVLDFSKLESGKFSFENISFNILTLAQNLIKTVEIKAQQTGLIVELKIDQEVPTQLIGDPHRLNQILLNLCSNAVKFTKLGYVRLKISVLNNQFDNCILLFEVQDTGIGIAEEKMENIFEEFTQAENSTTRQYGGTGLVLTITKKLIELQAGKIYVKSTLNVGTSFYVELPFVIDNEMLVYEIGVQ